jgi:tyrosyl-tRNA synthetase
MEVKKLLAHELVKDFWNAKSAGEAADEFARTVQHKELPVDITKVKIGLQVSLEYKVTRTLSALIVDAGLAKSRAAARRLIEQNAVDIDGKTVTTDISENEIRDGSIIKVGKRHYFEIVREK